MNQNPEKKQSMSSHLFTKYCTASNILLLAIGVFIGYKFGKRKTSLSSIPMNPQMQAVPLARVAGMGGMGAYQDNRPVFDDLGDLAPEEGTVF